MPRHYGVVRELDPTPEQAANLARTVGSVRFAQNWALAYKTRQYGGSSHRNRKSCHVCQQNTNGEEQVSSREFVKVFSGSVRPATSPNRELDTDLPVRIGDSDFVKELSALDKRRKYHVELHWGAVRQLSSDGRFVKTFDPAYRADEKEKLIVSIGDAAIIDRFEVEFRINLLAFIASSAGKQLTLIVASDDDQVNLLDLPKPLGGGYVD